MPTKYYQKDIEKHYLNKLQYLKPMTILEGIKP